MENKTNVEASVTRTLFEHWIHFLSSKLANIFKYECNVFQNLANFNVDTFSWQNSFDAGVGL